MVVDFRHVHLVELLAQCVLHLETRSVRALPEVLEVAGHVQPERAVGQDHTAAHPVLVPPAGGVVGRKNSLVEVPYRTVAHEDLAVAADVAHLEVREGAGVLQQNHLVVRADAEPLHLQPLVPFEVTVHARNLRHLAARAVLERERVVQVGPAAVERLPEVDEVARLGESAHEPVVPVALLAARIRRLAPGMVGVPVREHHVVHLVPERVGALDVPRDPLTRPARAVGEDGRLHEDALRHVVVAGVNQHRRAVGEDEERGLRPSRVDEMRLELAPRPALPRTSHARVLRAGRERAPPVAKCRRQPGHRRLTNEPPSIHHRKIIMVPFGL